MNSSRIRRSEVRKLILAGSVELKITGETDEEKVASLVAEMIRTGLTRKM